MSENRKIYHVLPAEDGWEGRLEDALRASVTGKNKEEVLERTVELAQNRMPSQVIIHKADGTIQTEHTYGDDPYPPKG
ncbi:hypothetical protein AMR72_16390 [Flavobacterium psychrophilum]|nr:hypothetical protein AMR72_16390 [Flavobacterium psychrophilum]AOE53943.1 hypothetical protein ALW18_16380 [Flavobacterium psychrophilum]